LVGINQSQGYHGNDKKKDGGNLYNQWGERAEVKKVRTIERLHRLRKKGKKNSVRGKKQQVLSTRGVEAKNRNTPEKGELQQR